MAGTFGTSLDELKASFGGVDPIFSSIVQFEAGTTTLVAVAKLTESTAVVCYEDSTDSNKLKLSVLTGLDGASPSAGTPVEITASNATQVGVSRLSDTTAAVVYSTSGVTVTIHYLSSLDGTPSVASGTTVASSVNGISNRCVVGMNSTTAAVVYINGTTQELKVVSSLSTTPSVSSATTIKTSANDGPVIEFLSSTTIACLYRHTSGGTHSIVRITGITTTPALGTEGTVDTSVSGGVIALDCISSTSVLATYNGASVGEIVRITGLDGTPSVGTAYAVPSNHIRAIAVSVTDDKAGLMVEDTTSGDFADYHRISPMSGTPAELGQFTANASNGYFVADFRKLSDTSGIFVSRNDSTNVGELVTIRNM